MFKKSFLLLVCVVHLFALRDAVYLGVYKAKYFGEAKLSQDRILKNQIYTKESFNVDGDNLGFKFGKNINTDRFHISKLRVEFAYEQRDIDFSKDGTIITRDGSRGALGLYVGKNLDLFLNSEDVLYFKSAFGYSKFKGVEKGSDLTIGVSFVHAFELLEFEVGYDVEFRRWGGYILFPLGVAFDSNEITSTVYSGLNFRF